MVLKKELDDRKENHKNDNCKSYAWQSVKKEINAGKDNFTNYIKEEARRDIIYAGKWYNEIYEKIGYRVGLKTESIF